FPHGELADPAPPYQHRRVAVEVRRGEERRPRILDQRLLVGLRRYPEHDHVRVALTGDGIDGVRARVAKEHKGLPADLVDRVFTRSGPDRDVRHAQGQLVYVREPGPARSCRHLSSVGVARPIRTMRARSPRSAPRPRRSGPRRRPTRRPATGSPAAGRATRPRWPPRPGHRTGHPRRPRRRPTRARLLVPAGPPARPAPGRGHARPGRGRTPARPGHPLRRRPTGGPAPRATPGRSGPAPPARPPRSRRPGAATPGSKSQSAAQAPDDHSGPGGGGAQAWSTASSSISMRIWLETTSPPPSSGRFQVKPQSSRSMVPAAVKTARWPPQGSAV